MTVSVANKRRKKVVRRNTWPADSPRKLNMQKKYQQRLKIKSFPEPFWANTYEWLVMQHSPEEVKCAPLAKLTEFVDLITVRNFTPVAPYTYKSPLEFFSSIENKPQESHLSKTKFSDIVGFYFIVNASKKVANDPKKYLMKLKKRCLSDINTSVRDLNPADFVSYAINEEKTNSNDGNYSKETYLQATRTPLLDANGTFEESFMSENYLIGDAAEVDIEDTLSVPFHVTYQQLNTPVRSTRPFHALNMESSGDVLIQSSVHFLDNDVISMKSKIPLHNASWNKENIVKTNRSSFPDAKFPKPAEKFKVPVSNAMGKKILEVATRKPLECKPVAHSPNHINPKFGIYKLPKDADTRNPDLSRSPQDMPDPKSPDTDKSGSSKDNMSPPSQSTSSASSSVGSASSSGVPSGDASSGEVFSSNLGQRNKPYARQLFEKDIQSNFSKSSKTKDKDIKLEKSTEEKTSHTTEKLQATSADDGTTTAISDTLTKQSSSACSIVPSEVVGFSFLNYLKEHSEIESSTKEAKFPASVIGHAFLNALVEQQNKSQESLKPEKSIPASVVGLSFLKSLCEEEIEKDSKEQFPASALGHAFLESLASNQNRSTTPENRTTEAMCMDSISAKNVEDKSSKEQSIPSAVVGQAFLKTLMNSSQIAIKSDVSKTIPSPVVGQAFLKSLIDQSETRSDHAGTSSTIPANVLGQSFLKNLLEQSSVQDTDVPIRQSTSPKTIETGLSQTIPATVLGQSFIKALVEEEREDKQRKDTVPAPVVGQAFLKTLIESQTNTSEQGNEKSIPSSVVGQTFLKTLIEEQSKAKPLEEKNIPASVVGQAFLKTLLDQETMREDKDSTKPVPSTVIGQAFLKSLIGIEQPIPSEESSKAIPSSVVGQAFLKTLLEQGTSKEDKGRAKPIPSTVVGQSFLKSLMEVEKPEPVPSAESKAVPSTVVSQAFLKMLVDQEKSLSFESSESAQGQVSAEKVIPAPVLSQTFLKSLMDMGKSSSSEESSDKPIPATVVSQAFLKTLISEKLTEVERQEEKSIPASVVGQAFLKTLMDQGASPTDSSVSKEIQTLKSSSDETVEEKVIPSTVLGQAFLKSLIEQDSSSSETSEQCLLGSSKKSENPVPASVIGSAFLKALSTESSSENVQLETYPLSNVAKDSMPANVIGQAFLKTLLGMASETLPESPPMATQELLEPVSSGSAVGQAQVMSFPKDDMNGNSSSIDTSTLDSVCARQLSDSDLPLVLDEQNVIIPPPPEFSSSESTQPLPGTSTEIDATSEIIGELLSYTKMMHSVIESLKDSSSSQTDSARK